MKELEIGLERQEQQKQSLLAELEQLRQENRELTLANNTLRSEHSQSPLAFVPVSEQLQSSEQSSGNTIHIRGPSRQMRGFSAATRNVRGQGINPYEVRSFQPADLALVRQQLHYLFAPVIEVGERAPYDHLAGLAALAQSLPPQLRATPLQLQIPHSVFIDMIPSPSLRDRLVALDPHFSAAFVSELCGFLYGADEPGKVTIWGNDWLKEDAWEFSTCVFPQWGGWLLTEEWMDRSRFWCHHRREVSLLENNP